MKHIHIIIFIILASCTNKKSKVITPITEEEKTVKTLSKYEREKLLEKEKISKLDSLTLDSFWELLVFEKGGCLSGAQYLKKVQIGGEASVLSRKLEWSVFLNKNRKELADFLSARIPSKKTTKIHTCPFQKATEGEFSVYLLQAIYNTNWHDLKGFTKYKQKEGTGDPNSQELLWEALSYGSRCEKMKAEFMKLPLSSNKRIIKGRYLF